MNAAALTLRQMRYVNKAFWRNPASAFFTFAFPLMFLVIFTSLLGHNTVHIGTRLVNLSTYYVAAMASFAVISACYTNIATAVTFQRDAGVLKRLNGTPLPSWSYLGARILHALLVSVLLVAITAAFGRAFYSADIPTGATLLRFLVMLVVGAAAFCALGFAITAVIPNADASPAIDPEVLQRTAQRTDASGQLAVADLALAVDHRSREAEARLHHRQAHRIISIRG